MCLMRMTASGFTLDFRSTLDFLAEIPAEILGSAHVRLAPAEQRRQFELEIGHAQQAGLCLRLELDQQIDVAVGTRQPFQRRAEQREAADAAPTA